MGSHFTQSIGYRDSVLGCWMGKNCGGTLGAPLEKVFGEPDCFDIWWYPEIREGGIPNDDLEMQLIWLKALEEVGPGLKAADLVQYWLDHIGYNWDEYGLSKTNMRLGLLPPIASSYNNWFIDCMGCPIRSEIWACVAPGAPQIAVKLAYEDAICDHAGGESVFGEMFNTSIESAAFVEKDLHKLIEIGRSYVPDWSATAKAIDAAVGAYRDKVDWKLARRRVYDATPNYNAQYSPINIGFQVVALLYGEDFGDAICKAVNCGYDTDCTGATVGSILGIILGASGLPKKWTDPLGTAISTNESWGGLPFASSGPNPVPIDLNELTDRTIAQARRVLAASGIADHTESLAPSTATDAVKMLWESPDCAVKFTGCAVDVVVDYSTTPTVIPGQPKKIITRLTNLRSAPIEGESLLRVPEGWHSNPALQRVVLAPRESVHLEWIATCQSGRHVNNSNRLTLSLDLFGRTKERDVPVVLIGSRAMQVSEVFHISEADSIDSSCTVEDVESALTRNSRPGTWLTYYSTGNVIELPELDDRTGTVYVQQYLWIGTDRQIRFGVPATVPTKLWLNGENLLTCPQSRRLRPNYGGDESSYVNAQLHGGWNEILIKYTRQFADPPFAAHLTISDPERHDEGLIDAIWTRFPWDCDQDY